MRSRGWKTVAGRGRDAEIVVDVVVDAISRCVVIAVREGDSGCRQDRPNRMARRIVPARHYEGVSYGVES